MTHGAEYVYIRNGYKRTVSVAYMRYDPDCQGEGGEAWEVRGWRVLSPGASTKIHNPTENQWFYVFAEATDGAFWAGPFVASVEIPGPFHLCSGLSTTTARRVGFRELDTAARSSFRLVG